MIGMHDLNQGQNTVHGFRGQCHWFAVFGLAFSCTFHSCDELSTPEY